MYGAWSSSRVWLSAVLTYDKARFLCIAGALSHPSQIVGDAIQHKGLQCISMRLSWCFLSARTVLVLLVRHELQRLFECIGPGGSSVSEMIV